MRLWSALLILASMLGVTTLSAHAASQSASQSTVTSIASPVQAAARPKSSLSETQVEERLHLLSGELRCLVCQNESLASSRAPLAEDLRREVREQIRSGKSNPQIVSYLTDRYGDFVTYRPPWSGRTLLLWLGPLMLLILAMGMFIKGILRKTSKDISAAKPDAAKLAQLHREFK